MVTKQISVKLEGRGNRQYFPGEMLAGSYGLEDFSSDLIDAVEVSVLWHTEGKGNEDMGIHAFWRRSHQEGDWIDPLTPGHFNTTLPNSPLTYEGALIKLHWCIRVRVFFQNGRQVLEEVPFRLGNLSNVRTLKPIPWNSGNGPE